MTLWFEMIDGKPTVIGRYSIREEPRIQFIFKDWEMADRVLPMIDRRKVKCIKTQNLETETIS